MVKVSPAFQAAVVADTRYTVLRAVVEIISPDIVYGTPASSGAAPFSQMGQLHDHVMRLSHPYATLEANRWILDGTQYILDRDEIQGQQGWGGTTVSDDTGAFPSEQWVQLPFTGVALLQAASVYFSEYPYDGVPTKFKIEVLSGDTVAWTQTVEGATASFASFEGFSVENPTAIRVTFEEMDLPDRVPRVAEIVAGIYEEWHNDDLAALNIKQQGDPSCLSLPYGTATLSMDNSSKRFDPGAKGGIFRSLEERQGIQLNIGVRLPTGAEELAPVGMYYQYQGGWKTGSNGLTMQWNLVDIIGLLTSRTFMVPTTLPTTLEGWIQAIVSQLGVNFTGKYTIAPGYASAAATVRARADVEGMRCGDLLRYVCMATGTCPRAGNLNGNLWIAPLGEEGNELTLDNLDSYPTIQANNDVAAIIFTLFDGASNGTEYIVQGNEPSSSLTVTVQNPFIHTQAQAQTAAALILAAYGGNKVSSTGRGDASGEIGDLDQVQINPQQTVTGRRIYQTFAIQGGVLRGCQSSFLVPEIVTTGASNP